MDWLGIVGGDVRGAQNRGIFSIHPAVFPSGTEWGLTHVNPWFIKKWIDLLLQSITVIKILATLLLPPSSPPPKWKVELKNTEADQDSKHARTARLHQKKKNPTCQPPFQGLTTPLLRSFAQAADIQFSPSTADVRLSCTMGACSPGALPGPTVWQ